MDFQSRCFTLIASLMMATMTATFMKPSSDSAIYRHPQLTSSKSSSSTGYPSGSGKNSRFPYLSFKSPESLYGDGGISNSAEAATASFLLQSSNLLLRSSPSLYDSSNYARTTSSSPFSGKNNSSFAHPDFDVTASMLLYSAPPPKSTVIPLASNGHRMEVPKGSRSSAEAPSVLAKSKLENGSEKHYWYGNNSRTSASLIERLTPEEKQMLSHLLYEHFLTNGKNASKTSPAAVLPDPVPADYDEEDPRTWPSNWLAQVPTMILQPEVYLSSKPLLNAYQRQLIRRISAKYEPLVLHYHNQICALRGGGGCGNEDALARKLAPAKDSSTRGVASNLSAKKSTNFGEAKNSYLAQQQAPLYSQMNNGDLANFSQKEADGGNSRRSINGGLVSSPADLRPSPSLDSSLSSSSASNSMSSSRSNSSLSSHSPSPKPIVVQAADGRENRLARLSQQMANKWSNKMKIYLRKN